MAETKGEFEIRWARLPKRNHRRRHPSQSHEVRRARENQWRQRQWAAFKAIPGSSWELFEAGKPRSEWGRIQVCGYGKHAFLLISKGKERLVMRYGTQFLLQLANRIREVVLLPP